MPDESINCCVTSPPYYGLRDYGAAGQIGMETDFREYIARLVEIFEEVRRVLKSDGTLWLNLGDSYNASGRVGHGTRLGYKQATNRASDFGQDKPRPSDDSLKPKDLMMIPARVAIALQDAGWYLRSDIIWHKPNPMPESVTDRPTKAHEYLFLLAKSEKYAYDSEAIKEPCIEDRPLSNWEGRKASGEPIRRADPGLTGQTNGTATLTSVAGRNKRTVWTISTDPFPGAHFAVMPTALVEPCILAGCPEGGTVYDPFSGSGTVGVVALRHGRNFIGSELNPAYVEIARKRIQDDLPMFNEEVLK